MPTANYSWQLPDGTSKPDVVKWIDSIGNAADAELKRVEVYGATTRNTADTAKADALSAATIANNAKTAAAEALALAQEAKAIADAALPKTQRVRAGRKTITTSALGIAYVDLPPGYFTVPPRVVITPNYHPAADAALPYIGDGSNLAEVSTSGFWVGGLPINTLVRFYWVAVQAEV